MWPFTRTKREHVSASWLAEAKRKTERVEFHGVSLKSKTNAQWPVRKLINEASPRMNAERLRKRA